MWRWSGKVLMTLVMSCWLVSTAQASPIAFLDTFTPGPVLFASGGGSCSGLNGTTDTVSYAASTSCQSLQYTHSLSGFNASTDTLLFGLLTLTFYDDNKPIQDILNLDEYFKLSYGTTSDVGPTLVTPFPMFYNYGVLGSITNGALDITISRQSGDFYFAGSTVTAGGTRTIPEPSATLLLGLGLAGIAGYRRFRQQPQMA